MDSPATPAGHGAKGFRICHQKAGIHLLGKSTVLFEKPLQPVAKRGFSLGIARHLADAPIVPGIGDHARAIGSDDPHLLVPGCHFDGQGVFAVEFHREARLGHPLGGLGEKIQVHRHPRIRKCAQIRAQGRDTAGEGVAHGNQQKFAFHAWIHQMKVAPPTPGSRDRLRSRRHPKEVTESVQARVQALEFLSERLRRHAGADGCEDARGGRRRAAAPQPVRAVFFSGGRPEAAHAARILCAPVGFGASKERGAG
ncbi:MAG: hypothetical protein IPN71_17155 [Fibrobacteres bacterium]|nr:hypothetical protein [Fibrobacterota bacterium]